jgi:hypothetical protein
MSNIINKYFVANIKRLNEGAHGSVSWARRCLDSESKEFIFKFDGRARIPIFYGKLTAAEIQDPNKNTIIGRGKSEARSFIQVASSNEFWNSIRICIIDEGYVWVVSPSGGIEEFSHDLIPDMRAIDSMKCFRVNILAKIKQQNAPFVLASQKVNRYYSSGTFIELKSDNSLANKLAIESLVSNKHNESIAQMVKNINSPLELLSSSELETLIAHILEEHGLYVASRVPGGLQNIDIIGWNDSASPININGLYVGEGDSVSIQVKRGDFDLKKYRDVGINYFIVTGKAKNASSFQVLGLEWLLNAIKISPKSKAWLDRSTKWAHQFFD